MTNLTTTQKLVLTSACEQADGIATRSDTLNRSAAAKVAAKLLDLGLVQERRAKPGWPVWRTDADGKAFSLRILKPGRAIMQAAADRATAAVTSGDAGQSMPPKQAKSGSKKLLIVGLLQRDTGATMDELIAATGWLPHTTRAALSGLRKGGLAVELAKGQGGAASAYRIAVPATAAVAC